MAITYRKSFADFEMIIFFTLLAVFGPFSVTFYPNLVEWV